MIKHRFLILAVAAGVALAGTDAALARKHHPATQKPAGTAAPADEAKPSQPIGKLVEYTELEQHVGSDIVVETTLGTVRRGKLVKYTNPGLTIQLGPEHGSVELSVPRETVRNVSLMWPPAEPTATPAAVEQTAPAPANAQSGAGSAKKN
jgi:hypothetical protein